MAEPLTGFEGQDIRTLIDNRADWYGDRTFLTWEPFVGERRHWSYSQFRGALRRFAGFLAARDVKSGERVLIHMTNAPEAIVAWLGCAYAGVVGVTTNTASSVEDLSYFTEHSGVVGGVTQAKFIAAIGAAAPSLPWLLVAAKDGMAPPAPEIKPGPGAGGADVLPFRVAADHVECSTDARPHDPMAPFGIQYTSGTTARPKAVLWTHANALWGARLSAIHEGLNADDVHLIHLPLFHTNAQIYSLLASFWAGGSIVVQPRFSRSRFWEVSVRNRCTWTSVVPFCVKALLDEPVPADHAYRFWGNALCEPESDALFGIRTIGWWGMTETVTHGTIGNVHGRDASMSMGHPSPGYEIFVLDQDGRPVAPGSVGDLFVRGRRGVSLFAEYVDDPEATAAAFTPDGLFRTGDRVMLGANGFLYFADRAKDMLKVGGENVAASEVEAVIRTVAGVVEVAVVGRPHPMLDEVPVAFVIGNAADTELPARIDVACTRLSSFKRPREIRIVDTFPRAALGKVAKVQLRELLHRNADIDK